MRERAARAVCTELSSYKVHVEVLLKRVASRMLTGIALQTALRRYGYHAIVIDALHIRKKICLDKLFP